jgi:hypothetical protein
VRTGIDLISGFSHVRRGFGVQWFAAALALRIGASTHAHYKRRTIWARSHFIIVLLLVFTLGMVETPRLQAKNGVAKSMQLTSQDCSHAATSNAPADSSKKKTGHGFSQINADANP